MSHQWTSFQQPDASGDQLRAFQRLVVRMLTGEIGDTAPTFTDAAYLGANAGIKAKEWQAMLASGEVYIWLDYGSVPQLAAGGATGSSADHRNTQDASGADLMKAVNSIPAYVERCSHFFVLCPPVPLSQAGDLLSQQWTCQRAWALGQLSVTVGLW